MAKPFAIVGGETLLGRELIEVLKDAGFGARLRPITGGETGARVLVEEEGEAAVMLSLDAESLAGAAAVLLAGSEVSSRKVLELLGRRAVPVIDATGALEDRPAARLRCPALETARLASTAGVQVVAHPAAIALGLFFRRLHAIQPFRSSVVTVLEPASERGQAGLDELHKQTVGLLSFQKLEKKIFDAQAAFNLLSAYGEDAPRPLESIELRIERNLATLLSWGPPAPMPSLRLVQAPVFHGYSFPVWVEFEISPNLETLAAALSGGGIDVRSEDEEPPTNAGAAGQSGIAIGSIAPDRNHPHAAWFWIVGDNLRLTAESALEAVRELAG